MRKRRASEEDCSKRPQKRKSTVNMSGWRFWSYKEEASTSQGKLKFRRSGNESQHRLATEFINKLTEKIPSLTEVSAEEEEDIFLVFSPKGTNKNLSETKPSVHVVLRDIYPELDSVLDTSSSSSSGSKEENTMTVNCWSQKGINIPDLDTVSEWIKDKQLIPDPPVEQAAAQPGEVRFLRCVSGNTLGSDDGFIGKLRERIPELKEEFNVEKCHFILVFCPVISRAGTDIEAALKKLQNLSETKHTVLVVLHHTFDQELIVPDSSRSVNRENTLTVDCLFHEDRGLLQCAKTQEALDKITQWIKILETLGIIQPYNTISALWNMVPDIPYITYITSCFKSSDPKQQKDSTIKAGQPEDANKAFTNKLQKKDILQDVQKTLSLMLYNTNPKHMEDEQHANLIKHLEDCHLLDLIKKHLREIEQELSETSAEEKIHDKKTPTNNETICSPPPPTTSKDLLHFSVTETKEGFLDCEILDKGSENTDEINLTASPEQNTLQHKE